MKETDLSWAAEASVRISDLLLGLGWVWGIPGGINDLYLQEQGEEG